MMPCIVQHRRGLWAASAIGARRMFEKVIPVMASVVELRRWFEQKVVENQRLFYAIAYQILGDAHEAEDAVQASVCKGWSGLGELHDPAAVVGWVAKITRHTAIDFRRRKRERATEEDELAALDAGATHLPG